VSSATSIAYTRAMTWIRAVSGVKRLGIGVILLVGLGSLSVPLHWGTTGAVAVAAAIVGTAWAIGLSESRGVRATFLSIVVFSLALKVLMLDALALLGVGSVSYFGPDSRSYLAISTALANDGLRITGTAPAAFGTYDVAHFYLFALPIRLGADVAALQLLNGGVTALAAGISYLWLRRLVPAQAAFLAAVVAMHPSLAGISIFGLLKDPSIVLATTVTIWGLSRLWEAASPRGGVIWGLAAAGGLIYLRMDRGYVAFYMEIAVVAMIAFLLLRHRLPTFPGPVIGAALGVLLLAEFVPNALGWPSSPELFASQVSHVMGAAAIRETDVGGSPLVEAVSRSTIPSGAAPSVTPPSVTPPSVTPTSIRSATPVTTVTSIGLAIFRRGFGPYPWVMPTTDDPAEILKADYYLYPGMVLWYLALPLVIVGLFVTAGRSWSGTIDPRIGILAVFTFLYFGQYLMLNVSYRQREDMMPVLALLAIVGWSAVRGRRLFKWAYSAYWSLLLVAAALQIALRLG